MKEDGNYLKAKVLIDGVAVGWTPYKGEVSTCAQRLRVEHEDAVARSGLNIEQGQPTLLEAIFPQWGQGRIVEARTLLQRARKAFPSDPILKQLYSRTDGSGTQIGTTHQARIDQQNNRQYARIEQSGTQNRANVDQRGVGEHFTELIQQGDENDFELRQEGAGANVLYASQQGDQNRIDAVQSQTGAIYNAAIVSQKGNRNDLALAQDGADNQATLVQQGDDNIMSATQIGDGNRLNWLQDGSNLSDLMIHQSGGAAMQVTQTNSGR